MSDTPTPDGPRRYDRRRFMRISAAAAARPMLVQKHRAKINVLDTSVHAIRSVGGQAMSSRLRRSLVLTTLLALLVTISGAAARASLAANPPNTKVSGIDVDATTIPQLQGLMNSHRINSVELTNFYLRRIRQLNPTLNAVITVSPTALADARAADAARRNGDHRPLLGIPIIVKDNVNTTGMPTTAGSWALAGSTPADAFIVQRLKAAGALIIGKANLSEWANFRSAPSSSGWSGIGGQTNMPYVLDRNPCGSSSGSGVVAAADLAVAAVGTETDGSIVCPSGANGDVGIKPTLGLWSRAGVVPITANQDTAGPITRNVTDAAVLLGAATGIDSNDSATTAQAGHAFTDYTQFLNVHALNGARIGVWRKDTYNPAFVGSVVEPILANTIAALKAEGATVVDPTNIDLSSANDNNNELFALLCEFKTDIATYLHTYVHGTNPVSGQAYPQTLADLIAFDAAHPNLEGPWNDLIFELAEETNGRDAACAALRQETTPPLQAAIDQLMAANHLDAIIALTNGPAWPTNSNPDEGDLAGHFGELFVGSSTAAAVSGYADITVPTAFDAGLPIGITFIGGRWAEPKLIGLAYDYEQATHVRVPPQFIPTIGDALFPGVPNPPALLRAQRQQPTQHQQRDLVVRLR
jgi:amidase